MRIVFAGSPALALPCLEQLIAAGHEIVAVLTQPDSPQGRKRLLTSTPVAQFAEEHSIPVIKTKRITNAQLEEFCARSNIDLGVVVAYGALIPDSLLDFPHHGWINLHFSALPQWRGAAPAQWCILSGAAEAATTVFQLVSELDAGPVFAIERTPLGPDETSGELLQRLSLSGARQVVQVVESIAAGVSPVAQQGEISVARKLTIDDAHLLGDETGASAYRRFLAVTPEPGAWFHLEDQRIKVVSAERSGLNDIDAGQLCLVDGNVYLGTKTTAIKLTQVIPAGKSSMSAQDWWRGRQSRANLRVQ